MINLPLGVVAQFGSEGNAEDKGSQKNSYDKSALDELDA
jgi:hypothetical protein